MEIDLSPMRLCKRAHFETVRLNWNWVRLLAVWILCVGNKCIYGIFKGNIHTRIYRSIWGYPKRSGRWTAESKCVRQIIINQSPNVDSLIGRCLFNCKRDAHKRVHMKYWLAKTILVNWPFDTLNNTLFNCIYIHSHMAKPLNIWSVANKFIYKHSFFMCEYCKPTTIIQCFHKQCHQNWSQLTR